MVLTNQLVSVNDIVQAIGLYFLIAVHKIGIEKQIICLLGFECNSNICGPDYPDYWMV